MKLALSATLFLSLFVSASSLFAATVQTVKVSDGKAAYCKTKYDVKRNIKGAYNLKATDVSITEDKKLNLNLRLMFLKCSETAQGFSFVLQNPYAEVSWTDFNQRELTQTVNKVSLKAFQDGVYKILLDEELENESIQNVTFKTALNELISEEEILAMKSGDEIIKSVDFFLIKNIEINANDGFNMRTDSSFGSFRTRITISRDENGLKADLK